MKMFGATKLLVHGSFQGIGESYIIRTPVRVPRGRRFLLYEAYRLGVAWRNLSETFRVCLVSQMVLVKTFFRKIEN